MGKRQRYFALNLRWINFTFGSTSAVRTRALISLNPPQMYHFVVKRINIDWAVRLIRIYGIFLRGLVDVFFFFFLSRTIRIPKWVITA